MVSPYLPSKKSCVRIELEPALDDKLLFRKGTNTLDTRFGKSEFLTNKFETDKVFKKQLMTELIYLVQKHRQHIKGNTQTIIKNFLELENGEFETLIDLSKHRYPRWDALLDKLFTKSVREFCQSIGINDLIDDMTPDDPKIGIHRLMISIVRRLNEAQQLTVKNEGSEALYFNLFDLNLSNIVLCNLTLPATFSLANSQFNQGTLTNLTLQGCNLESTSFIETTIGDSEFQETPLQNTLFTNAILRGVTFKSIVDTNGADFTKAETDGLIITDSHFTNSLMNDLKAPKAQVSKTRFVNSTLIEAAFRNAHIQDTHFLDTNLQGSCFQEAIITNCTFRNGRDRVQEVSFANATLNSVRFSDLNITKFNFTNTDLISVTFTNCRFGIRNLMQINFQSTGLKIQNPTFDFPEAFYSQQQVDHFFNPNSAQNILTRIDTIPDCRDLQGAKVGFFQAFLEQLMYNMGNDPVEDTGPIPLSEAQTVIKLQIPLHKAQFVRFFFGLNKRFLHPSAHRFLRDYVLHPRLAHRGNTMDDYQLTIRELDEVLLQLMDPAFIAIQAPYFYSLYNSSMNRFLYACFVEHAYSINHREVGYTLAQHYLKNMPTPVRQALRNLVYFTQDNPPLNLFFVSADFKHIAVVSLTYYERFVLCRKTSTRNRPAVRSNINFTYLSTEQDPHTDKTQYKRINAINLNTLAVHLPIFQLILENSR